MRQIIINADDFGLTEGINRGIVKAYSDGILTSASLLPNGPKFNDAVALSRENPGLGVGVHLNIFRGKPILGKSEVSSLIDKNGYFISSPGYFFLKSMLNRVKPDEIENEFRAQISRVISAGILPSHLDTEKHIHVFPFIYKILFNLATEFKIGKVRCLEPGRYFKQLLNIRRLTLYLLLLSTRGRRKNIDHKGILTPKCIYGLLDGGNMFQDKYRKIFNTCEGNVEIVCHPGYTYDISENINLEMGNFYINRYREKELEALLSKDLKDLANNLGIKFITYRGLN